MDLRWQGRVCYHVSVPLAPVPPLTPAPSPPPPPPPAGVDGLTVLLGITAVVSLALNGWLGWNVWHVQRAQGARLARLEAASAPAGISGREDVATDPAVGKLPRRASLDQRVAALLAVSGDGDRCRRLLENVSPAECVELGQALLARPTASDRNGALGAAINFLAATHPWEAVGLLDGVREGILRVTLARQLADTWSASHADAAALWLAGDGSRYLTPVAASAPLVRAITQWCTFDPEGATKFVASQGPERGPVGRSLGMASHAWGQTNPGAALAWVNSLSASDPHYLPALQGVWEGWTEENPDQAGLTLRQQFYGGATRPPVELAGTVARQWAQIDPAAAGQWALSLPANGARGAALYQVGTVWTQADAAGAARWAATLPTSETRARVWREIISGWADSDPIAAGTWLGTLPQGRDHDEAVGAYLPRIEPTDPEKALSWAGTVSDPVARAEQVQDVLSRWVRRDAAAARGWAAANSVPILPPRTSAGP